SHGSEAVETSWPRKSANAPASLQWSHGSEAVETPRTTGGRTRPSCFNGATARRPWKPRSRASQLQWSHGSEAVETFSIPRYLLHSSGSFNGATARRPWKREDL